MLINTSKASSVYIRAPNLAIIVSADALEPTIYLEIS